MIEAKLNNSIHLHKLQGIQNWAYKGYALMHYYYPIPYTMDTESEINVIPRDFLII